jgi:hypothetical protein
MTPYTLTWPDGFENFSWELESKGWFVGLEIVVEGKTLRPTFYDPVRLAQDIAEDISNSGVFSEPYLIVIERLTPKNIESTIASLAESGELRRLIQ